MSFNIHLSERVVVNSSSMEALLNACRSASACSQNGASSLPVTLTPSRGAGSHRQDEMRQFQIGLCVQDSDRVETGDDESSALHPTHGRHAYVLWVSRTPKLPGQSFVLANKLGGEQREHDHHPRAGILGPMVGAFGNNHHITGR